MRIPFIKTWFLLLSEYWQNLPLSLKGSVVITVPLMVLLASLGSLYQRELASTQLENKLKLALQNQRDIQTVHSQLLEASTGVRDYLLTGDTHFLKIVLRAEKSLPLTLGLLTRQLEDPAQQQRLQAIIPLVEDNLRDLRALSSHESNTPSEKLTVQFKSQVSSLERLRTAIEKLNEEEARLVAQDQQEVFSQRQNNITLTLIAAISGIVGSFLGVMVFSRTIVNRVRLLRDSAGHLAKAEALELPMQSKDELGQLSDELEHASQLLAKTMNDALQAKRLAEEANASKSMFLSRTSHELRTPLNAILGFAQLLELDLEQSHQRENATRILAAGQHLLKLINEVLEIARLESGESMLELTPVEITPLLEEAITFISPIGRIRDISIILESPSDCWALANRQKLLQVVLNILSNALKYGPPNANINVTARKIGPIIQIDILDQGAGIPVELRERLFTPFDRLGAEHTKVEGTGLGLSLSKQLMQAMQGSIHVAKHKSLFWLELQATGPDQPPARPLPAQPINTSGSASFSRILYVEDNISNSALVEAIIKRQRDFKIDTVRSLRDARLYLSQQSPDIVLLDIDLPDGLGDTLISELQSRPEQASIPIIILSADARPERIETLSACQGVFSYMTKPLNIGIFIKTLRDAASQRGQASNQH